MDRLKILNGNKLKIIAIISMFVDHFSKTVLIVLLNLYAVPRLNSTAMSADTYKQIIGYINTYLVGFGRIAFPLYCFLIAEGFHYTKNRLRYLLSMLVFAILSEVPFDLLFIGGAVNLEKQNVYFTLLLGVCTLFIADFDRIKAKPLDIIVKTLLIGAVALSADYLKTDYGTKGVIYITALYLFREKRSIQPIVFLAAYTFFTRSIPSAFILTSAGLMYLYNGERGHLRVNKYVFYAFYPVHILLLFLAAKLLT